MSSEALQLCNELVESRVSLSPSELEKIIVFTSLYLLESGDVQSALNLLSLAEEKGLVNQQLESLYKKVKALVAIQEPAARVKEDIENLFDEMENKNVIDVDLLNQLKEDVDVLAKAINEARNSGLDVDSSVLDYARDIYNILYNVKDAYQDLSKALTLVQDFVSYVSSAQQALESSDDISTFTSFLRSLEDYGVKAGELHGALAGIVKRLSSIKLNSSEGASVLYSILQSARNLDAALRLINSIGVLSYNIGVLLDKVENYIKSAYNNPNNSPFGSARNAFINDVSSLLTTIQDLLSIAKTINPPNGADLNTVKLVNSLKELANGIATSALTILKNMKYYTTFNDYRWNNLWESAESQANYDLGNIDRSMVQLYEFKGCTISKCDLEKRTGVEAKIAEHMPSPILKSWTTVEEALNAIEMYNRWAMDYSKNPLVRALGDIGYVGASMIMSVGSLFAPRLLAEQLTMFKKFIVDWVNALKSHNMQQIKNMAHMTWKMLFGSKEAILSLIGFILLGKAIELKLKEVMPNFVEQFPTLAKIITSILQGDVLGPGFILAERVLPVAEATRLVEMLIEDGVLKLSRIARDSEILARAAEEAEKITRIRGFISAEKLGELLKKALKDADTLDKARANLEELLDRIGLEELKNEIAMLRSLKTTILTNLKELELHAPTLVNQLKKTVSYIITGEKEEIPAFIREELEETRPVSDLLADARKLENTKAKTLLELLAEKKLVTSEALETMKALDEIIETLKNTGKTTLAEALERLRNNLAKLSIETKRLADIKQALDNLEELREKAAQAELWKKTIETDTEIKPEPEWITKERSNLESNLEELREKITSKLETREKLASELSKSFSEISKRLKENSLVSVREIADSISSAVEKAGMTDLATQIRKAILEQKMPLRDRIAYAIADYARELMDKIQSKKVELMKNASMTGIEELGFKESGLPSSLAKMYFAGLRAGEYLADRLMRLAEALAREGLDPVSYERGLVDKLSKLFEKEYSSVSLDNLAFLKGLREAVKEFEKSPYGMLLRDLDMGLSRDIEAIERPLSDKLEMLRLRDLALKNLRNILESGLKDYLYKITSKLLDITMKMKKQLEKTPGGSRALKLIEKLRETEPNASADELIETAKITLENEGVKLSDTFWNSLKEYIETRDIANKISELRDRVLNNEPVTLTELQDVINSLARIDMDLAYKLDWSIVKGYLDDMMRELEKVKNEMKNAGLENEYKSLEELTNEIREITSKEYKYGPFEKLTEILKLKKNYSELVNAFEKLYDNMAKAFGEDKVKEFRKLLDEFEEKLANGEFDKDLLEKMQSELRKFKIKNVNKYMLTRLKLALETFSQIVKRIIKGKTAVELENAAKTLSDEIKKALEKPVENEEKGWLRREVKLQLEKLKYANYPKELVDKIAEILSEKEKKIRIMTREGEPVEITRKIDLDPQGRMTIEYDITFPGEHKITYKEVIEPHGNKAAILKQLDYDPEIARALSAYEEARAGLREFDNEARLGEEIYDILNKDIASIDPDYKILNKIVIITDKGPTRLLTPFMAALKKLFSTAEKTIPLATALTLQSSNRAFLEKLHVILQNNLSNIDTLSLYENISKAIDDLAKLGITTNKDQYYLALTPYAVSSLTPYYNNISLSNTNIINEIENKYKINVYGTAPFKLTNGLKISFNNNNINNKNIIAIITSPEDYIKLIKTSQNNQSVTIKLPTGLTIKLPTLTINKTIAIVLPPFTVNLPKEIEENLERELEKMTEAQQQINIQKQKQEEKQEKETNTIGGEEETGKTAFLPPFIPIILPILDLTNINKKRINMMEKERLNII